MSMSLRVTQNILKSNSIVLVMWPISSNMIFAVLFYFVFEMSLVQSKILSSWHTEYHQRVNRIFKERVIVLSIYVFGYILQATVIYYLMSTQLQWSRENSGVLIGITIAGRILKFVSIKSGLSEAVEIENKSAENVFFVPVSPAFQEVELVFGKKVYEIPSKK